MNDTTSASATNSTLCIGRLPTELKRGLFVLVPVHRIQNGVDLLPIKGPRIALGLWWLTANLLHVFDERAVFRGILFERFDQGALLVFEDVKRESFARDAGILLRLRCRRSRIFIRAHRFSVAHLKTPRKARR